MIPLCILWPRKGQLSDGVFYGGGMGCILLYIGGAGGEGGRGGTPSGRSSPLHGGELGENQQNWAM